MEDIFFSIGVMVILATIAAYLGRLFKQPMIPAYIIAGIILGPIFGIITNSNVIATLSEIGIAFLLFIAGLELDIRKLKEVGLVSTIGGFVQVLSLFAAGFLVAILVGFGRLESIYLGIIVALSSTMVVIKILSDRKQIDTLHGKIIIGFLIIQDFVAIFALSIFKSIDSFTYTFLLISLLKAAVLIGMIFILARFIVPAVFKTAAKSREMLFLMAITFLFLSSIFFQWIGEIIIYLLSLFNVPLSPALITALKPGFSIAIGAFAAGVGLASLPFNFQIIGQVKPLRDFFSTIFFVSLGLKLTFGSFESIFIPFIILLVIIVLLKPFVVASLVSFFGYMRRTSLTTGISLGQISEFSLILVAQGLLMGHISDNLFTLTILLAIFSISLTSYIMKYDNEIFAKISPYIRSFDRIAEQNLLDYLPKKRGFEVIICGYSRIGFSIGKTVKKLKKNTLIVDFNPDTIRKLRTEKINCIYGDIGNREVLERLDFKHAKLIISTVPTFHDNELLISTVKRENKKTSVIVTANQIEEALTLYRRGADYVILPHFLGGKHVSTIIEDSDKNLKKLLTHRLTHIEELRERKSLGHEHPRH
ncbi:cation:proton antiporter [Nanoarchaeota archaeon]